MGKRSIGMGCLLLLGIFGLFVSSSAVGRALAAVTALLAVAALVAEYHESEQER